MQILSHVTDLWAKVVGIAMGLTITRGRWTILFDRIFKTNCVTHFITPSQVI